jgi:hypothetical protein
MRANGVYKASHNQQLEARFKLRLHSGGEAVMAIKKSAGVTPTERLLANLCDRSFLKLWSYPNPFKDDGNELCDLLAVFENRVFIFFDRENKQIESEGVDPSVSWMRWKRKVIDDQIRTAGGAQKYIRSGRSVFLDQARTVPFPLHFSRDNVQIHKIIVAHGAQEACLRSSDQNIYGSLGISYGMQGILPPFPFTIDLDRDSPVHVLDSHNLPIVFGELDTFYDFTSYIDAKIAAIKSVDLLSYCGEEDLLAHYFSNFDESVMRHFIGIKDGDYNSILIGEGEWKSFSELPAYNRKKIADQSSYLWDAIIQRTCDNAINGTLGGNSKVLEGKSAIHEMAKEPRVMRRALSDRMIEAIRNFPEIEAPIVRNLTFMRSFYEGKAYVFLQLKLDDKGDYEKDYRPKRQALLEIACAAAKNKYTDLNTVVGIAIDAPKYSRRNSEDFILMDCGDWPEDRAQHYRIANEGLNFFATAELKFQKIQEFPQPRSQAATTKPSRRIGRNEPCPCCSGRKYKKCCGRV